MTRTIPPRFGAFQTPHHRRGFLTGLGAACAGAMVPAAWAWAAGVEPTGPRPADLTAEEGEDARVARIVRGAFSIDTHNHIDVPLVASEVPGPALDITGELTRAGLSAVCATFAVDYQALKETGQAYVRFVNGLDSMDAQLRRNGLRRALNLADLENAQRDGRKAVVQSVEGAHFLEGFLDRLQEAYGRGVRHLGLLHDNDATPPLGDVYTNVPRLGGLTMFGKDVLRECNRLGILVDLAHAGNDTLQAGLRLATRPVLVSHTGLDTQVGTRPFMAKMMRPRLISKAMARSVADQGGVIGVWTHLADTPLVYAENLRALVDVVGIDHVCIGTDTKLTPPSARPAGPAPQAENGEPGKGKGNREGGPGGQGGPGGGPGGGGGFGGRGGFGGGPGGGMGGPGGGGGRGGESRDGSSPPASAPAGGNGGPRPGERTNDAWPEMREGFYFSVVRAMLQSGFTEAEIRKIGGGNFCRVFGAATAS
ncbi:Membrane dipeptidase (Peptidase family M19) [Roseateles sp. YR242]|uniref:dipeptidase n=1 Tax=Roseateles sp. YR242 TaxID=1855305 RepID=UPI0008B209DF|nr:membrane dipeptidase [Roseateles sp. YR242]SEL39219.1 Membrane dipeptidase (Peptidase family M19) [Roseateles sp. YR242]